MEMAAANAEENPGLAMEINRDAPATAEGELHVVEPPRELAWTGTTMGSRAVHVFRRRVSAASCRT
jgi:hypothetical protein